MSSLCAIMRKPNISYMRLLPDDAYVKCKYYDPYLGIFKTHGDTSKIRIVFDATAKVNKNDFSL